MRVQLDGFDYSQPVFRYQRKCLDGLRAEFEAVSSDARHHLRPVLEATGCWRYFERGEDSG